MKFGYVTKETKANILVWRKKDQKELLASSIKEYGKQLN
jgi:hypothetical protein